MAQVQDIMTMYEREGLSQRQIARQMGVSRNTVQRVLENPAIYLGIKPRKRVPRENKVMTPTVMQRIDEILQSDKREHRKQRHTAHRIWERLLEEGHRCAESTVRRYVGQKKRANREVFIPLEYAPGEAAQIDWGTCIIEIGDQRMEVQYFTAVLCWSRAPFTKIYHAATQEAFLDGLASSMEYFGGTPERLVFDRLSSAVKTNTFRGVVEQQRFTSFKMHYGFEATFCNGGKGNEKGIVENKIGSIRRNLMVPVPRGDSLPQINEELLARCQAQLNMPVPDGPETSAERLAMERPLLNRLPNDRYPCYRSLWTTANKTSLLNVAKNWYSVPPELRGKRLTVHLLAEQVEVYDEHKLVACHERVFGEKHTVCNLDHYLDGLLQKPGALRNARPYLQADLPVALRQLHRRMLVERPQDANLEMVKVLLLARAHGLGAVGKAADQALRCGVLRSDAIEQSLESVSKEVPKNANLEQYRVRQRTASEFNVLVAGGDNL